MGWGTGGWVDCIGRCALNLSTATLGPSVSVLPSPAPPLSSLAATLTCLRRQSYAKNGQNSKNSRNDSLRLVRRGRTGFKHTGEMSR